MPFVTATREGGATLIVHVDQIRYVVYQDTEGREEVGVTFGADAPGRAGEISIRGMRPGGCGKRRAAS